MPVPVTFLITDLHRGGVPLLLAALCPALAARGRIQPEVISIAPLGEIAGLLQARNVPVVSLKAAGNRDVRVLPRFLRYLHDTRPAVICSILVHANMLATFSRPFAPPAAWIQSLHTVQEKPRWHWQVQGAISSFADAFVAPSRAIIDKLALFGPLPPVTVIPNGIDVGRFAQALPIDPPHPWPEGALVVGNVGRFDPVKRLPLLIRATAEAIGRETVRPIHLVLAGYGAQERELKELARQLGIAVRVHFPGPTRTPERWYKTFDLFCLPSAAEGFPLVLIEAAAAGLPVVACRSPAIVEALAETPVRWLAVEPTVGELAQILTTASTAPHIAPHLPTLPPLGAFVERYAETAMVARYESLLLSHSRTFDS